MRKRIAAISVALLTLSLLLGASKTRIGSSIQGGHLPSHFTEDVAFRAAGFLKLKVGMTESEVRTRIGSPEFVQKLGEHREFVYMLEGTGVNDYKFIRLLFNADTRVLEKGFYERPAPEPNPVDTPDLENVKSLGYIG